MKKCLTILFYFLFCSSVFAQVHKDVHMWEKKAVSEKNAYIEGMLDGMKLLSLDIDTQISVEEKNKTIDNNTVNKIEIPIIYVMFTIGNIQTNGVQSIVNYINECYEQQIFRQYSIYELLVLAARGNLMQNEKFSWIFE